MLRLSPFNYLSLLILPYLQLSIQGVFVPIVWNGEPDLPLTTVLAGDRVEWRSQIPADDSQPFSLVSLIPMKYLYYGYNYDLLFSPELIVNEDQSFYYTTQFIVPGNYTYQIQILVDSVPRTITGTVTVVPGKVWNPEINHYELMVGDILRWYSYPEMNTVFPSQFDGFTKSPGKPIDRPGLYNIASVYDYQFLIPGTYSYWSSERNLTMIHVRPGMNFHWSSNMNSPSASMWSGEMIRIILTEEGVHSPRVDHLLTYELTESFPLGTFSQPGEMLNITLDRGYAIRIVDDSENVNMKLEVYIMSYYGPLQFVEWKYDTSKSITIPPKTPLRFYVADERKHNVRIRGHNLEMVSGDLKGLGTYYDFQYFYDEGEYQATCDYHTFQVINITVKKEDKPKPPSSPSKTSLFMNSLVKYAEISALMIGVIGLSTFLPQQTACSAEQSNSNPPPPNDGGKGVEEITNVILTKVTERDSLSKDLRDQEA